jgi:Ca2+-binding RTX toxin-like protein
LKALVLAALVAASSFVPAMAAEVKPAGFVAVCEGETPTIMDFEGEIQGTPGDDVIVGNNGNNVIYTNGGSDLVCSWGGDDEINMSVVFEGNYGDESVEVDAGSGNDRIQHLPVSGTTENTRIYLYVYAEGGKGNDVIDISVLDAVTSIEYSRLSLYGDAGDDTIRSGGDGDHRIDGGVGNDRLYGSRGGDTITGGSNYPTYPKPKADRDKIYGGDGNDILYGGWDNDILDGQGGADAFYGQKGTDTCVTEQGDLGKKSCEK